MSIAKLSIKTRVVTIRRGHRVEFRVLDYYANILQRGDAPTFTKARQEGGRIARLWRIRLKTEADTTMPEKNAVGPLNGLL